jgi:hypothetical protein
MVLDPMYSLKGIIDLFLSLEIVGKVSLITAILLTPIQLWQWSTQSPIRE